MTLTGISLRPENNCFLKSLSNLHARLSLCYKGQHMEDSKSVHKKGQIQTSPLLPGEAALSSEAWILRQGRLNLTVLKRVRLPQVEPGVLSDARRLAKPGRKEENDAVTSPSVSLSFHAHSRSE